MKDFFRAYKDFSDEQLDTLEIILSKLYQNFGITNYTDYDKLKPTDYPIMEDLYALLEKEYNKRLQMLWETWSQKKKMKNA